MKRDWNELKAILEAIEQDRFGSYIEKYGVEFDSSLMSEGEKQLKLEQLGLERRDIVLGHVELLVDVDLIKGVKVQTYCDDSFLALTNTRPRITMEGYDLLEHLRSHKFIKALNEYCRSIGVELTLDTLKYFVPKVLDLM